MKYNLEEIKQKAEYCLNCKTKPCQSGCPLQNNIPDFIKFIKEEKFEEAFNVLSETTIFEPICGRICPHKSQCEGKCVRGIKQESVQIGELEAFIGEYMLDNQTKKIKQCTNKRIAVIGAGPSGLACSYKLSKEGYKVLLYERHSKLGGLLRYGIPEFRLDKNLLDKWLENYVLNENIEIHTNVTLGKDISLEQLKEENDAVVLAFGANISNKMNIQGEENDFVIGANEFLEYGSMQDFKNKNVAVIGGGNVAMDTARTIARMNANKITVIYRRSEEQMPAEKKEIEDAKKDGIEFLFQTDVINVQGENKKQIECVKTKLIEPEDGGRKYPVQIEGSNFLINIDYMLLAVGASPDISILNNLKLDLNKWGYIQVDENYKTSNNKVYAIGDLSGTNKTVAWAAKTGFECANSIIKNS